MKEWRIFVDMKFSAEQGMHKKAFGIDIVELCSSNNPFPIDGAVAYFRNNEYPCKINHGFYEMFYILDGECSIVFEDKVVELKKGDMHVIEPEKKHITQAKYADIFIVCNPPFDIKNVEFCEMNS